MMRNTATRSSLMLRVSASCVAVICILTTALGAYFYHSVEQSLEQRTITLLSRRASYYARLVREMYPVAELRDRPVLIESMLGAERDVLAFRSPAGDSVIEVNPARLSLPDVSDQRVGGNEQVGRSITTLASGTEVYWAWEKTNALGDGQPLLVLVGHPVGNEREMLDAYRNRIVLATAFGVFAATLLAYGLLRRGLRPISDMARKAAEIHPGQLDLRLDVSMAPTELRSLANAFNAMLDRLAEGYQRLSQFSADLAHEIRTPLGVLIGQTQVTLAQNRSEEEYRSILESNLEELGHLHRLGENMLFLARADHGKHVIERASIDTKRELLKIAEYFEGPALERGIGFQVEAQGVTYANSDLWRRAVGNLVINAIQHGNESSIIHLRGREDDSGSTVEVENPGPDLAPEQLNRLFDRFYKVDPSRSTSTESHGLGLGLAIVQAIMKLHGGTADVTHPETGVIRFRLHFPKKAPDSRSLH